MKNFKRTKEEQDFVDLAVKTRQDSYKLSKNKNYLIFISPEDAKFIEEFLTESELLDEYVDVLKRFRKQIKLNEKYDKNQE